MGHYLCPTAAARKPLKCPDTEIQTPRFQRALSPSPRKYNMPELDEEHWCIHKSRHDVTFEEHFGSDKDVQNAHLLTTNTGVIQKGHHYQKPVKYLQKKNN